MGENDMKYSFAVVDDEKEQTDAVCEMLKRYFKETKGEYSVSVFHDGAELLTDYKPLYDVIFLDIEMEQINGMKTAKRIRKTDERTAIVFITRLARLAIGGYEVSALDFIVKPVEYDAFSYKMKKILSHVDKSKAVFFSIKQDDRIDFLNEDDITYIEVIDHSVVYHTVKGDYREWGTLKNAERQLTEGKFAYCNRCYIVNLRYVTKIEGDSVVVNGVPLIISRYKKKDFTEALLSFWGERTL